jgi:integrase
MKFSEKKATAVPWKTTMDCIDWCVKNAQSKTTHKDKIIWWRRSLALALYAYTGGRNGEIATVTWEDIVPNGTKEAVRLSGFKNPLVPNVAAAKLKILEHKKVKRTKNHNREVFTHHRLVAIIEEAFWAIAPINNHKFVFTALRGGRQKGGSITTWGISKEYIKKPFAEFGYEGKVCPQSLRKTFAQRTYDYYMENGHSQAMALELVRRDLNHSSIDVTMHYLGFIDTIIKDAHTNK